MNSDTHWYIMSTNVISTPICAQCSVPAEASGPSQVVQQ